MLLPFCHMNNFPIDVLQFCIIDKLDFLSQIRLRQVSSWLHRLEIHDFYHIDKKYLMRLSDAKLKNYPFIKFLNARNNLYISNVNHLTRLIKLDASTDRYPVYCNSNDCKIGNNGIKNINLVELIASGNRLITDVNHMTNLQKLYATDESGISDNGIKNINLTEICIKYNNKIKDVSHMSNLKVLCAFSQQFHDKIKLGLCSRCDF